MHCNTWPRALCWELPWLTAAMVLLFTNDATTPSYGRYAIWLDADFAKGLSRSCLTFGSPPLVPIEEFDVGAVELWWLR